MRNNFNLYTHIILSKPRYPNASPDWLVIWHPLLEVPGHGRKRFVVDRHMVRVDAEDLRPAFATGIPEVVVDVLECLVDLCVDLKQKLTSFAVPST